MPSPLKQMLNYEDIAHRLGSFIESCDLIVNKLESAATGNQRVEAALLDARELLARIVLVRKKLREQHKERKSV